MSKFSDFKSRLLNSRLVTDSFWSLFGNVIGKGLALAAGIVIARFLGKDIFGEYGIIRNTIMSIAIFSTFGLGYTATKFVAENKNKNPEIIGQIIISTTRITLAFSGLMALALFFSANYVAEKVLEATHLATPLRLVSVLIVFNALTATQIGVLAGFGEFKGLAKVNAITGLSTFILSFGLTYFWNFNGAIMALLFSQIINWFLNFRLVKKKEHQVKLPGKRNKTLFKTLINFSTPVALQEALYSVTYWLLGLLLIKFSNYGELGIYTAAMQWNAIVLFIPGILRNVILSHLSEASDNESRHNEILKKTLFINFLATLLPFIFVLFFSGLIEKLYGSSFSGLKVIVSLAVFSAIFSSLSNVYSQAFMSKGLTWAMFLIRALRDFGTLFIGYYLLNKLEEKGGAFSIILANVVISLSFLIIMALVYKYKAVQEKRC